MPPRVSNMVVALLIVLFLLLGGVIVHAIRTEMLARNTQDLSESADTEPPFLIIASSEPAPLAANSMSVGSALAGPPRLEYDVPVPLRVSNEMSNAPLETSATVVFPRPSSQPVHVLPGRLEVLSGAQMGEDLRLVGGFGDTSQVVIGRDVEAERGVTLYSPTVSRRHARMTFADGQWTILNLSNTNPIVINHHRLLANSGTTPLADGDQIELGEVVLRFHAQ